MFRSCSVEHSSLQNSRMLCFRSCSVEHSSLQNSRMLCFRSCRVWVCYNIMRLFFTQICGIVQVVLRISVLLQMRFADRFYDWITPCHVICNMSFVYYYILFCHEMILLVFDCILVLLCCYFDIGINMYNILRQFDTIYDFMRGFSML